jgi:PEP-CTERM motif
MPVPRPFSPVDGGRMRLNGSGDERGFGAGVTPGISVNRMSLSVASHGWMTWLGEGDMKKLLTALAGVAALALATPATAGVTITFTGTSPVPGNNDFNADLASAGLTQFTTTGATITLSEDAQILFEFLGSESGFSDTFSTAGATPVSLTETSSPPGENHFAAPIVIGADSFLAGSLASLLNFSSSGPGADATVGDDGFGIFLGPNAVSGLSTNVFYLGYDDQINMQDDNHDDFIVRATVLPEPGTWAMMLLGFGAAGFAMRRHRKPALAQVA